MAKATNTISNFLAEVSQRGLSKPCRFEVIINKPACITGFSKSELPSLFCDQAYLPPTHILTSKQSLYGPPSFHPTGIDYGGQGMSLTFFVDRMFDIKLFFDKWADGVVNRNSNHANYQSNYLTDITIKQLDENDSVTYQVKVLDAYPMSVNSLTLDHGLTNTTHKLSVQFHYRKWSYVQIGPDPYTEATKTTPDPRIILQQGQIANNLAPGRGVFGDSNAGVGGLLNTVKSYFRF